MDENLKKAVREQRIPFIVSRDVPNEETIQAIEEVRRMKKDPNKKAYSSFPELLEEIENEV